jgi:acyl-CoA synthetase (AMP-forming)/AMP-acid ligase II
MQRFASLPEALEHWAGSQPERIAFEFLATGEQPTARISYRQLHEAVLNWADALREHGAATKPVLILLPSGLEFMGALFGCFYAGSPAVPLYPPGVGQPAGACGCLVAQRLAAGEVRYKMIRWIG